MGCAGAPEDPRLAEAFVVPILDRARAESGAATGSYGHRER